jgi:transcriptional regulator with PAS, ATPase and Fis domain
MSDDAPRSLAERHLAALRDLLRRDVLTRADWSGALRDTAAMASAALEASAAFVALDEGEAGWVAWTGEGERLAGAEISLAGSQAVLDEVRRTGRPLLTTVEAPLLLRSESLGRLDVRSVLAVPLGTWGRGDDGEPDPRRTFAGCLYADRRGARPPFDTADVELVVDLAHLAERTLSLLRLLARTERDLASARQEVAATRGAAADAYRLGHQVSHDPEYVRTVLGPLARAARAGRVGLLLLGPTGSGKSHLAREFHYASRRRDGPFVTLDCGQITSAEALGAELFGFARKSGFNAPAEGRLGKARLAHGGTLFVDEIGSLPLELQPRLLRLIQTGRFTPLGSAEEDEVDVQVIAAANEDLEARARQGSFREDLLWRLSEISIALPSLDTRRADIPAFAERFLAAARERFARPELRGLTAAALAALAEFPWSRAGNLRGLEHAVHRSALLAPDGTEWIGIAELVLPALRSASIPPLHAAPAVAHPPRGALAELLAARIAEQRGNLARVAEDPEVRAAFGCGESPVPSSTLRVRLRQLGLGPALAEARRGATVPLPAIRTALLRHRDAAAAAAELGISRDSLLWRLRGAGLSVRQVLGEGAA